MKLDYVIDIERGNCHIVDSYKVTSSKEMKEFINANLRIAPFNIRNALSYVHEWKAHNFLYKIGYKRERTKDVDLNFDETFFHRLAYFFLSFLY